ncbi:MAG: AraC family transcriptional regulator [Chitinophagaceae bacterium]|nr:MAG: AraC family transcriptional regulator [Chitinophagaceae bacterium]
MNPNDIVTFIIAGSILLLAFLLLINPLKVNKKGNFYFGLFLLIWSTFWLEEAFGSSFFNKNIIYFSTKSTIQFLVAPFFYLSIENYINPSKKYKSKELKYLLIVFVYFLSIIFSFSTNNLIVKSIPLLLIIGNGLYYSALAYIKVSKHQQNIEIFISNKEPINLAWIKNIVYLVIACTIVTAVYSIFFDASKLNLYINLYFLAVVYLIAYYAIKQREIFPQQISIDELVDIGDFKEDLQNNKAILSNEDLNILKERITTLMVVEKPYLDSELNLVKLADMLSISSHQLSYAINKGFNENFFQYINKFKVKKAEELLKNPKYDNYTILAIGFESGFNSKTAFNTTFKKFTTHTPTEYRKHRSVL